MHAPGCIQDLLDAKGRDVLTVDSNESVAIAAKMMIDFGVSSLIVVGPSRAVEGIVTARDVLRATARDERPPNRQRVASVMSRGVQTTTEEADLEHVEQMMRFQHIRHLPVLRGYELVGIVTHTEVLRHSLDQQQRLDRALEEYIVGHYPG